MPTPERHTMIALSTGHIKEITRQMLSELAGNQTDASDPIIEEQPVVYAKNGYGWFLPVLTEGYTNYPDLTDCIQHALYHGADWIMFDCDAEPTDALPLYD